VARGLAHAHAEGVVHRDLKPSNVFVTNRGQVKILDFGMAHAFGRRRLSGGTPAYMAPEQWEDDPEDERTDVFALGVMLHRMLSGEYPFPEGEGRWSAEPATAPKLEVPGAPGLAEVVDRMLGKAPKGRPRDGAAALAALAPIEEALRTAPADRSASAHAPRRPATLDVPRLASPRGRLAVLAGVALLAALTGAAWYLWTQDGDRRRGTAAPPVVNPEQRTVVAVADFANDTGEKQLGALTGLLVTSLEQSRKLLLLTRGRMADVARQLGLPSEAIDEVTGRGVGQRAGATVLLIPTVHKLGATYVVELRALDLGRDQYRFTVKETAGSQEDLIGLIDRLSDRTREELRETPAEVASARVEVGKALSHSLEAYQHYLKGRDLRLKQCDNLAAEKEQRRALDLDPEFGAAHMELGVLILYNGGTLEDSTAHFQAARKLTSRLPEKERRIVELDALVTPTVPVPGDRQQQRQQVMKGLDELMARYPQDEFVLYWGGWAHLAFGEWRSALESYRRSLEVDPGQCYVVSFVTQLLERLDRPGEVLPVLTRAVEARPNAVNRARLALALAGTQPEEATRQARESLLLATDGQANAISGAACALAITGLPEEAVTAARRVAMHAEASPIREMGWDHLAVLAAIRGRPREAAAGYDVAATGRRRDPNINRRATLLAVGRTGHRAPLAVAELRGGPNVLFRSGELALYGDSQGAAEAATSLVPGSPADLHYRAIRAAVERRWDEAIPALRRLLDELKGVPVGNSDPRPLYRWEFRLLLGEALMESGNSAEALQVLESATPAGLCGLQAAAHFPNILVTRARTHERLGHPADALRDLDRLLALWKDAEPGLPLHAEARAMRARLAATAPNYKEALVKQTQEAIDRGAFGAPLFFVGAEMFIGNDRLDFVEEALRGA
jgi:tetratricopeptide (TPR) repeat protein